jgi:DNA sulfur modification protein DndD
VILSTDTEVDRQYYQLLQPYLARAYHLDYDEANKASSGREGYFWKEGSDSDKGAEPAEKTR